MNQPETEIDTVDREVAWAEKFHASADEHSKEIICELLRDKLTEHRRIVQSITDKPTRHEYEDAFRMDMWRVEHAISLLAPRTHGC